MNKNCKILLIALSFLFALMQNLLLSMLILFVAMIWTKDNETIRKVAQPTLILLTVQAVLTVYDMSVGTIRRLLNLCNVAIGALTTVREILCIVCLIYLVVFVIIGIVQYARNKDIPIYGKLTDIMFK